MADPTLSEALEALQGVDFSPYPGLHDRIPWQEIEDAVTAAPKPAEDGPRKFCVRYYREETSSVRMDITVTADSPEAARERVRANMTGEIEDLTDEEEASITSGKEEVTGGEFTGLADPSDPNAVTEW